MDERKCIGTAPDGSPCPWGRVDGWKVCTYHLDRATEEAAAKVEQQRAERAVMRQRAAELRRKHAEGMREFKAWYAANLPRLEQEEREREAERKQARRDAWHARRREQDAQRRAETAEARKAAQEAAQDPATRQTCRTCGRSLPLNAFHRDRRALLGRKDQCRACKADHDRARREADR